MTEFSKTVILLCFMLINVNAFAQTGTDCARPATVVVFRTFNFFSFKFSYRLFAGDSLLGRIKTNDVFIMETYDPGISFHATAKAPSLNETSRTNYQKKKAIRYPMSLQQGQVYFVKCDYLNQSLFEYPRQPTIRLIKGAEVGKYMKKRFLKKRISSYLYAEWQKENNLYY